MGFTPPETFPHECTDMHGNKLTIIGQSKFRAATYACETLSGVSFLYVTNLRDLPKVESTWQNVYPKHCGEKLGSRVVADNNAGSNRIAVLRRDIIDGVTTCELENV